MASTSSIAQIHIPHPSSVSKSCIRLSLNDTRHHTKQLSRRIAVLALTSSTLIARDAMLFQPNPALGFDLRMTVPDQTVEEAESTVRDHARALLGVKPLIEQEDWRELQEQLRKKSSLLKQDIYTIIQSKPGIIRPQLRKLYFDLFNNVTKLDYAARDKDVVRIQECYENISIALEDILSRILVTGTITNLFSIF